LMHIRMRLYASADYLAERGNPESLNDLSAHRLICQNPNAHQVAAGASLIQKLLTYQPQSTLTVNNYFGVLQGVIHNLGIGVLPNYVTHDFPDLVRVLPETDNAEVPVFLAYPEELRHSRRIAAFRDFVQDEIIARRRAERLFGQPLLFTQEFMSVKQKCIPLYFPVGLTPGLCARLFLSKVNIT
jgi:DNA-binding transcriptional LysR family regulator